MTIWDGLQNLRDEDLLARLDELVRQEKQLGASIVAHLVEVERRGLHLEYGYSSLFKYCVERLKLTEEVAYKRMQAARAAKQCPAVLEHLHSGDLSLTSLGKIAPHLKKHGPALVEAARGKSVRQVKRLVAELDPDPRPSYCKMQPMAGGRVKIEMVVDAEVAQAIEEAAALDRHLDPSGDRCALLGRMAQSYLEKRKKERYAMTDKPRSACPDEAEGRELARRTVPAQVQREVIERDGERCTWEGPDGTRCTETGFLEIDHRHDVALGGRGDDVSQVQVLCRAHNQYKADKSFGVHYMDRKRSVSSKRAARQGVSSAGGHSTWKARKPELDSALKQVAKDVTAGLHRMGFTRAQSRKAVECALAQDPSADLESLLKASLLATRNL